MGELSGMMENKTKKVCLVDGRLYEYDVCSESVDTYKGRSDLNYIGRGVIFSIDGVVQQLGDRFLSFWEYDKWDWRD